MKKLKVFCLTMLGFGMIATGATACTTKSAEPVYAEGEQTQEVVYIEKEQDWVEKWFSADKIAMYMSWLAYIGTIIGLAASIKRLKQSNNLTLKNVSDEVQNVLSKTIGDEVAKQFEEFMKPLLKGQEEGNKIMSIFAKILALSQENTPESRVAILNLIEELGAIDISIIETAKKAVELEIKVQEAHKKEIEDKLDKIIKDEPKEEKKEEPEVKVYDGTSI